MGVTCNAWGKNKRIFARLDYQLKAEKERFKKAVPKKNKKED